MSPSRRPRSLLVVALLLLAPGAALAKLHVVATLPDLAAIASEVTGDLAEVHALASPRQDPHYVDPKPSLVLELNRADLVIVNGLQLEDAWLAPLLTQARNPKVLAGAPGYVDASSFVELLEVPSGKIDRSMGDVHPGGNPHFLFDPRRGAKVALGLGERLAAIDAEHAGEYRKRAQAYAARLEAFAVETRARLSSLPKEERDVVAYHKSLVYLFDWLALDEVATLEPRPGIPPDPGHVARVLSLMKQRSVRAIVQEEFYPTNASKTLSQLTKAKLVVIHGGTRVAEGETYEQHLQHIAEDLHAALAR